METKGLGMSNRLLRTLHQLGLTNLADAQVQRFAERKSDSYLVRAFQASLADALIVLIASVISFGAPLLIVRVLADPSAQVALPIVVAFAPQLLRFLLRWGNALRKGRSGEPDQRVSPC